MKQLMIAEYICYFLTPKGMVMVHGITQESELRKRHGLFIILSTHMLHIYTIYCRTLREDVFVQSIIPNIYEASTYD